MSGYFVWRAYSPERIIHLMGGKVSHPASHEEAQKGTFCCFFVILCKISEKTKPLETLKFQGAAVVDDERLELLTSALRTRRSPN